MMIVLPEWHPHAGDPSMPLAALAPDTLILFPRTIGPGRLHDAIIASCQRAGFSPKLGQEASQTVSIVHMVAAGFGVSIVPRSLEQIRVEGAVYLGIEGEAPRAPVSLAYRRDDRSAIVRNFVALARRAARSATEKKEKSSSAFRLGGIARLSRDRWSMFPISQPIKAGTQQALM
jgi:DNA-binding transcriptional LysR family regulator